MSSDQSRKIIDFIGRHQLLSSFICMHTLFLVLYVFLIHGDSIKHKSSMITTMHEGLGILPSSIPVIVISIILWGCMNVSNSGNQPLGLLRRCKLVTVSSFCTIFPILAWMSIHTSFSDDLQLILAPIISLIYSVVLGVVFGSQAQSSKGTIIVQSAIVSFIMGSYCLCLSMLSIMRI
jgi:hypothetical protein